MRPIRPLALALALVPALAGCPGGGAAPATSPVARGTLFQDPPPQDPYAGPPKVDAPARTTPSGLELRDAREGTGAVAEVGRTVVVDYRGWLSDRTVFDSTRSKGPFTFTLGAGDVIKGWEQGIAGMKVGGLRRLVVPPELGYGGQRAGKVPPGSTLTFDVELLDVR